MLLFRLCAEDLSVGLADDPLLFTDPSAVLLEPCIAGETIDMGVAVVLSVGGAFATASICGASALTA